MTFPIGPIVDATAARRPERVTLQGRFATLVPLAPEHAEDIYAPAHGPEREALWAYMGDGPFGCLDDFRASIAAKATATDAVFYAVTAPGGTTLGYLSLMRIDQPNRVIEIGNILYTPPLQRTPAATEAIYLAAKYVFEDLGYRRFEWKCNNLNAPSKRAAVRFGFAFEGLFRQHMIIKGRNRDTAWYAMLDGDWPARKAAFERWLAPGNFDAAGKQKVSLSSLDDTAGG